MFLLFQLSFFLYKLSSNRYTMLLLFTFFSIHSHVPHARDILIYGKHIYRAYIPMMVTVSNAKWDGPGWRVMGDECDGNKIKVECEKEMWRWSESERWREDEKWNEQKKCINTKFINMFHRNFVRNLLYFESGERRTTIQS